MLAQKQLQSRSLEQNKRRCVVSGGLSSRVQAHAAAARPVLHTATDWQPGGFNVPVHHSEVHMALSVVQPVATRLMAGSTGDNLQAHIISSAVSFLQQKLHHLQSDTDPSGTSVLEASRTERAVRSATEGAADALLLAANGHNSKPGVAWESFPAALQAPLFDLFHQQGWVTSLGLPIMQQQLPYSLPMDLQQYNAFICNPLHEFFIASWTEHYWFPITTPTPAAYPWLHTRRLQLALTEDWVLALAARLPAFWPVIKPAVAAGILPQQLIAIAQEAANQQPPSTVQLFMQRWIQQAGQVVGIAALQLLSKAGDLRTPARKANLNPVVVPVAPLYVFTQSSGSGSGGRSYGALTAVGAGDEGSRVGRAASAVLYSDSKKE